MIFTIAALLSILGFHTHAAESNRAQVEKSFEQMIKNSTEGLAQPAISAENTQKEFSTTTKFSISSTPVPVTTTTSEGTTTVTTPCNIGVKVWFQHENGEFFNPIKRKMGVKEKFYVHLQAAVPVYVSLFQNYPDSRPASRLVYPDAKYPDSFKAILPGQSTRLPVLFEMDDDTLDEIMSMVVVRADAAEIQSTLTTRATSSVSTTGGVMVVTAQATTETAGTMKSLNDKIVEGENKDMKFNISAPAVSVQPVSSVPNDVAFFMFGTGLVGQWQLTLKK